MHRTATLIFACVVFITAGPARAAGTIVDFQKEIQPIFARECYSCHGPEKQKGGLRLDLKAWAFDGGTSGKAILPGKGKESLLVKRLHDDGDDDQMPLKKDPLSDAQIALVTRWVDQGAIWPDSADATTARHWSFVPPSRPGEPKVKDPAWVRNSIDAFVLAKLESEGLAPSPEASKETLLRRVSLDLTGLPPSPKEIDGFLADDSPNAYEKVVDRLLASPHYGERWARHWLDGARYADSNGYSQDNPRSIWPFRDWVIRALNDDMPFDQFAIEQLAGDLLPNPTIDQKVATGFHRNTQLNEEGGIDKEQFRVDSVIDRVGTTGTVFLGLTIACAQCHNHKFDPISQREYYRFFAFFNSSDEPKLKLPNLADEEHQANTHKRIAVLQAELKTDADAAAPRLAAWEAGLNDEQRKKFDAATLAALKAPAAKRSKKQQALLIDAMLGGDAEYSRKKTELAGLKEEEGGVTTLVMEERKQPRESFIFIKGDFTRHGDPVAPGTPGILPPLKADKPTRLELARWIVDPANPLTARVQVNRMWMHFFGQGIVTTENDFGTQGSKPTNPQLLDWLATEFTRQKWSTKALHRLMVTSAAYRQTSRSTPQMQEKDPYNKLLARQSRLRLDAEVVRDAELVASGLFNDKIGGPPVFPPQPEGVLSVGQVKRLWKASPPPDCYRRGLYTYVWRMSPHPLLTSFDFGDATLTCTRRARSNTPLQALTLLNDTAFVEFAQALAARTLREAPAPDAARIEYAFRLATGRKPAKEEATVLGKALARERAAYATSDEEAKKLAGERLPAGTDAKEFAAWVIVSRVVLNLDEAITRE